MVYLASGVCLLALVSFSIGRMRSVQLRRMAHTLGLGYAKTLPCVVTQDTAEKSYFLHHGQHQFFHVLTFRESIAFMRVCTDRICLPGQPVFTCTLVTAELTRGTFAPLVLMPRRPDDTTPSHPALPPELTPHFLLSAPDDFVLPPAALGFLKSANPCYIELTPTALLYHEFRTVPVAEIQPMRYRALQLLKAFVHQPQASTPASLQQLTQANLEVSLLLKLQAGSASYTQAAVKPAGSGRWVYGIIFILGLIAVCVLAAYALKHWLPH